MKRFAVAHLGLMVVLMASTTFGQAPEHNKHLAPMLPFIGKWTAELTLPEDVEGVGKKGDAGKLLITYSWTGNHQGIMSHIDWDVEGKAKNINTGIIVWDPVQQKIVGLTVQRDGEISRYEYHSEGDKLAILGRGVNLEGVKTEAEIEFYDVSQDSFLFRMRKRIENGKDTTPPAGPGLKAIRVKP